MAARPTPRALLAGDILSAGVPPPVLVQFARGMDQQSAKHMRPTSAPHAMPRNRGARGQEAWPVISRLCPVQQGSRPCATHPAALYGLSGEMF